MQKKNRRSPNCGWPAFGRDHDDGLQPGWLGNDGHRGRKHLGRLHIDVKDEQGKVTNWAMEMGSPNVLMRQGWRRDTLKIGDVVSVEGSKAKDGSPTGNARTVILSKTGQKLFAGSSQGVTP